MPRRLIPSMFRRRLWLLFIGIAAAGVTMMGKAYHLTVVQGGDMLARAERRLVSERWTPTVRGRILDRKGRVLAKDDASFDVLVDYPLISGEWEWNRASRQARRDNRTRWGSLKAAEREELIRAALPSFEQRSEAMWNDLASALGTTREDLELRRTEIRRNVQTMSMSVWGRWLEQRREEEARRHTARGNSAAGETITLADVQRPLSIHVEPHVVARGVTEQVGFDVRRLGQQYPGLRVEPAGRRVYPCETMSVPIDRSRFPSPVRGGAGGGSEAIQTVTVDGVATHILGWMRSAQAEDSARRPRTDPETGAIDASHYQQGDLAGAWGIERGREDVLRGSRGRRTVRLDRSPGDPDAEEVVDAVPGSDLTLTIDINLQARVQALMSPEVGLARVQQWHRPAVIPPGQPDPLPLGTPLNGAAVVYEIDSGEILAMVTTPSFTREAVKTDSEAIFADKVNSPWVNRAIAKPYPPGSIVKPIILSGAVTDSTYSLARGIECTGHLLPDRPDRYRCWVFKQFGNTHSALLGGGLRAPEAMAVSCNIFFYTLARDLGPERVVKWYKAFGVGTAFGLGIGDEYAGSVGVVPSSEQFGPPHAILMGIGQGPVAWTPLHAAEAYAILARGGLHLVPRIVRDQTPVAKDLRIDPRALDAAIEGLRLSVNDNMGTGHHLTLPEGVREPIFTTRPGIEVVGKTGTAEAPDILGDPGPDRRREILREGDHSWFVVMVGRKDAAGWHPRFAISVVMEYAGSGGRVSGPICNQIIEALIAEGYL